MSQFHTPAGRTPSLPKNLHMIVVTFLESFATILVEGALYFFCHEHPQLKFTNAMNLWLALAFGVMYIAGASASHAVSVRLGERRTLMAAAAAQVVVFATLAVWQTTASMFAGNMIMGLVFGMKWPVIESYASAGHAPKAVSRAIGRFNVSWCAALPVSLALAGVLIARWPWALFAAGGAIGLVNIGLFTRLKRRPEHLPDDHPERPDPEQARRMGRLLTAGQWLMLAAYSSMWILLPLMPGIFERHVPVGVSTALSGLLNVARLAAFIVLGVWTAWHGRRSGLVRSMALLPAGFVMVLFGPNLPTILMGELIFGWAVGEIYYAALYYAIVMKNASVAAGGGHESLIGLGLALGPAAGLLGVAMKPLLGSEHLGQLAAAAALLLICFALAGRALYRAGRPTDSA